MKVDQIHADEANVRLAVDENKQAFEELKQSIQSVGILNPVTVRPDGDGYIIVAGHRRFAAARELGLEEVPTTVKEIDDRMALEAAMIENLQRVDLNPMEEAGGLFRLMEMGMNAGTMASRLGRSKKYVTDRLNLLELPEDAQEAVRTGVLAVGRAMEVRRVSEGDSRKMGAALAAALAGARDLEWSVKQQVAAEEKQALIDDSVQAALAAKWSYAITSGSNIPRDVKGWKLLEDVGLDSGQIEAHRELPQHAILIDRFTGNRFDCTTDAPATRRHFDIKRVLTDEQQAERTERRRVNDEMRRRKAFVSGTLSLQSFKPSVHREAVLAVARGGLNNSATEKIAARLLGWEKGCEVDETSYMDGVWNKDPDRAVLAIWCAANEKGHQLDIEEPYHAFLTDHGYDFNPQAQDEEVVTP